MTKNTDPLDIDEFDVTTAGLRWVITDGSGILLEASHEAAGMLNLSMTGLRHRQLLVFFDGERDHWREALHAAAAGLMVDREGTVRPREKRPLRVRAEIAKAQHLLAGDALLWTFTDAEVHVNQTREALDMDPAHL